MENGFKALEQTLSFLNYDVNNTFHIQNGSQYVGPKWSSKYVFNHKMGYVLT